MDLTARIASGEGVERGLSMIQNAIQTVAGGRLQGAFWSEEPCEEQLENLAERV